MLQPKKKSVKKKPTYSENNFEKKNSVPSYMSDFVTKKYKASKSGKVSSSTRKHYEAPTRGGGSLSFVDRKTKSVDTTGYSAGKPYYTVTTVNQPEKTWNKPEYKKSTKIIPRKDVPKTLESMKKGTGMKEKEKKAGYKKGGSIKSKK
jgi:hypothetical protein